MIYLVFDMENSAKATFTAASGVQRKPITIKNNLFILQVELEDEIIEHGAIYTKREVLESEFIKTTL